MLCVFFYYQEEKSSATPNDDEEKKNTQMVFPCEHFAINFHFSYLNRFFISMIGRTFRRIDFIILFHDLIKSFKTLNVK